MASQNSQEKIQEMQFLEQTLQNLLFQKQAFQMESAETKSALKELENSGEEVFKVIGQLMLKSDKSKIKEDLSKKENAIDLRIANLEKQGKPIEEKLEKLRGEVLEGMKD